MEPSLKRHGARTGWGWKLLVGGAAIALLLVALESCSRGSDNPHRVVIWHQMRPEERSVLKDLLERYQKAHPGIELVQLYKETEELRSGYVIAAIAGQGPDLVYGPSDAIGIYVATETIRPLEPLLRPSELADFDSAGLVHYHGHLYQVADKIGNHLALVYNKDLVPKPPETDSELIAIAQNVQQRSGYVAGSPRIYGLAWNYTEPFFFIPFLTGFGGWVFAPDGVTPTLDTPAMVQALKFVQKLRDVYHIVPKEADYIVADALFKEKKAAMLINGDWSWAGYLEKGIHLGVAPLPRITETGLWCAPMTSAKGYSLNVNVEQEKLSLVLDVLRFLLSKESELYIAEKTLTAPTRKSVYQDPAIAHNEILRNSLLQIRHGRPIPIEPEMRAVWDAMRPPYQAVMGGSMTPEDAARQMQALAVTKIRDMKE